MMLSKKEIQTLEQIKFKIVTRHKYCNGKGYVLKDGEFEKCDCMKILSYIIELIKSNIPKDYWTLSLDGLNIEKSYKKQIKFYTSHIDNAIEQGQGFLITGEKRGIGKTSLACEIAKEAVVKRYKVYYSLMQLIISDTFTNEKEIIDKIRKSDLIVIDELDKVMMKEKSNITKQIENFLREILPIGKSIIICSNSNISDIEEKLSIESLLQRYMQIMSLDGIDYSPYKNKELKLRLKKEMDYFNENILNNARRFYLNEYIANEKEYHELFE